MLGVIQQPGRNADQLAVVIAFQRLIRGHARGRERWIGGELTINGILQGGGVFALAHKAERFNLVAQLQRFARFRLHLHPLLAFLEEEQLARLVINHRAGHLHTVAIRFLRRELQQAADGARRDGERILRSRNQDHQIVRARHHQPDRE